MLLLTEQTLLIIDIPSISSLN